MILLSWKAIELLENGLQPYSGETPLFSMRTLLLAGTETGNGMGINGKR